MESGFITYCTEHVYERGPEHSYPADHRSEVLLHPWCPLPGIKFLPIPGQDKG